MKNYILDSFRESLDVKEKTMALVDQIEAAGKAMCECVRQGGKIILMGNGGSAADSQHIAAELIGRFEKERRSIPAVALTTDTSILTSLSNDYDFEDVFYRQLQGLGAAGDLVIGITTSGNSPNILKAAKKAKEMGIFTIGLTGESGGKLKDIVDICLMVPSKRVCRIQESHVTIAHILCGIVENSLS